MAKAKQNNNTKIGIAIGIILLVVLVFVITSRVSGGQRAEIFEEHFYAIQAPNVMQNDGSPEGMLWVNAINAYSSKKYKEARDYYGQLREAAPRQMDMLDLYYAISCTGAGKKHMGEAKTIFTQIFEKGENYSQQAQWYLALINISEGNLSKSKSMLMDIQSDENHPHYGETRKILSQLLELE